MPVLHPLATTLSMLWKKPNPAQDIHDFIQSFEELALTCIENAYRMERTIHQSPKTGRLSTSLAEDVLSLLDMQYNSLKEHIIISHLQTSTTTTAGTPDYSPESNSSNNTTEKETSEVSMGLLLLGVAAFRRVLQMLDATHEKYRPMLLMEGTLQDCCAHSYDVWRMANKLEDFIVNRVGTQQAWNIPFTYKDDSRTKTEAPPNNNAVDQLRSNGLNLVAKWSREAVAVAERIQVAMMRQIIVVQQQQSPSFQGGRRRRRNEDGVTSASPIAQRLFSGPWEDDWTHNEVVADLLDIAEDYIAPAEIYIMGRQKRNHENDGSEVLYHKALVACCRSIVCFYVRCLVQKADAARRQNNQNIGFGRRHRQRGVFRNPHRAFRRMSDDIALLRDYFEEKAVSSGDVVNSQALSRIMGQELLVLEAIHECLVCALDRDSHAVETLILVLHKRTGADALVTRHFVHDLWFLVGEEQQQQQNGTCMGCKACASQWGPLIGGHKTSGEVLDAKIEATMSTLEQDLAMMSSGMKELSLLEQRPNLAPDIYFVRLDEMLKAMYEDRMVRNVLPGVCYWACQTKEKEQVNNDVVMVSKQLRKITRQLLSGGP